MNNEIIAPEVSVPDSSDDDGSIHCLRPITQGKLGTLLDDNSIDNKELVSAFVNGDRAIIKRTKKENDFRLGTILDSVNNDLFPTLKIGGDKKTLIKNNFWKYFRSTLKTTYQNQKEEENIGFVVLLITHAVFYFRNRLTILALIENDETKEKAVKEENEGCLSDILNQVIQNNYSFLPFTSNQKKSIQNSFWLSLHEDYKNEGEIGYIPAKPLTDFFNDKRRGAVLFQTFLVEKATQFFFDYILVTELKKQPIDLRIFTLFESLVKDKLASAIYIWNIKDEVTGKPLSFRDFFTELYGDLLADGKIEQFHYFSAFSTWLYNSPARSLARRYKVNPDSWDDKDDSIKDDGNAINTNTISVFDPDLNENCKGLVALYNYITEILKKEMGTAGERMMKVRTLRFLEDKTYGEIVYELGISSEENASQIISRSQKPINAIIQKLRETGKINEFL